MIVVWQFVWRLIESRRVELAVRGTTVVSFALILATALHVHGGVVLFVLAMLLVITMGLLCGVMLVVFRTRSVLAATHHHGHEHEREPSDDVATRRLQFAGLGGCVIVVTATWLFRRSGGQFNSPLFFTSLCCVSGFWLVALRDHLTTRSGGAPEIPRETNGDIIE